MPDQVRDWTGAELDRLRELDRLGRDAEEIASALHRDCGDVLERLSLVASSPESPRAPEPSFGPDEEGDVEPAKGRRPDDPAAWVHVGDDG